VTRLIIFIWLGFILTSGNLCAQTAPVAPESPAFRDPLRRDTPQSSVLTFLEECRRHDYVRACKYLDLRGLPKGDRLTTGTELARQLEQILDRDPEFEVAALSRNPPGDRTGGLPAGREKVASFTLDGHPAELQLQRATLRSGLSIWLFSADTVKLIPRISVLTSESLVERRLPAPLVTSHVAGTPLWRWIAMLLAAIALAALSGVLVRSALSLTGPLLTRFTTVGSSGSLATLVAPLRVLLFVAGLRASEEWIGPSPPLSTYLDRGLVLLLFLGLYWLCARVIDSSLNRLRIAFHGRHHFDSVLPLGSRVFKLIILLLAIAAALGELGYHTTTILAGLGVGGLAVALAAQKTLENFFGGVSVIGDRPVSVGDFCRFGDRVGTVEDIGLRSTRIRTLDRTLVTVPNGEFSSMVLENFSRRDKMWFHSILNLRRDTTPDQVRTVLGSITQILKRHPKVEIGPLPVRFIGVGTYSLDIEVFAYVLTSSSDEFMQIQQELFLALLDAIESAGTALALPTQASISYSQGGAHITEPAGQVRK